MLVGTTTPSRIKFRQLPDKQLQPSCNELKEVVNMPTPLSVIVSEKVEVIGGWVPKTAVMKQAEATHWDSPPAQFWKRGNSMLLSAPVNGTNVPETDCDSHLWFPNVCRIIRASKQRLQIAPAARATSLPRLRPMRVSAVWSACSWGIPPSLSVAPN